MAMHTKVALPDGYNGNYVDFYLLPVEADGSLVKLRCAEPGREYLIAWRRLDDLVEPGTFQHQY